MPLLTQKKVKSFLWLSAACLCLAVPQIELLLLFSQNFRP